MDLASQQQISLHACTLTRASLTLVCYAGLVAYPAPEARMTCVSATRRISARELKHVVWLALEFRL
eukprot:536039-Prymnesium_polylepis.1